MTHKRSPLHNTLKRIAWEARQGKAQDYTLEITDRLAPNNTRTITGDQVKTITPTGAIQLKDGTTIPPHRVRRILKHTKQIYPPPDARTENAS